MIMEESSEDALSGVVVTGYGTVKKQSVTGSISSVQAEKIKD